MQTGRKVAVVIAVADSVRRRYLAGALNGAAAFAAWAQAMKYDTYPVTDDTEPVTFQRLETELLRALDPAKGSIYRLMLYFAGHGLIRDADEGLWLLSDWSKQLRAVATEPLRRRLYAWDIQQISIFADACRDLPSSMDTLGLTADPVLGRGPRQLVVAAPPVAKFIAAQDGQSSYAVPGQKPEEDRCLFSGVLMEGLWAMKPGALSTLLPGKVTSESLGDFLRQEVPQVATHYKCALNPVIQAYLPGGDNVYFDSVGAPLPPPWAPWPSATVVNPLSAGDPGEPFARDSAQALIIGASIFCFTQGIEPEVREAISDSMLLAHLLANQLPVAATDPISWVNAFLDVLTNVGWTVQRGGWKDCTHHGAAMLVGNKLVEIMANEFGPNAASVFAPVMNAFGALPEIAPWRSLFRRESLHGADARCQIALVEPGSSGAVVISMLPYAISSKNLVTDLMTTDILAMKASSSATKLHSDIVTLTALRSTIRVKVRSFEATYVSSVINI